MSRIVILHDYFLYKGGGERLIISMAKGLKADVITSFIAKDSFDPREHGIPTVELLKESWFSRLPGFRYLQVQWSFLFRTKKLLGKYDTIIYSGDCLTALLNARGKRNIAYMHTPPRHLYDHFQETFDRYSWPKKLIFLPFVWFNRWRFFSLSQRFDLILTNSKNVQERIKRYLGLDSVVVYPPCTTLPFKNLNDSSSLVVVHSEVNFLAKENSNYFFSWARLYPIKRVAMIVEAFTKMPDKKLVIASGGPELERIKKLASGHSNITVLGWISDADLLQYLGKCLATIYIPVREDFGMSPAESLVAEKPVVGVAEGGMLEVLEDKKTAWLLPPDFTLDDLVQKIQSITPEAVRQMEPACRAAGLQFTEEKFISIMKEAVSTTPQVYTLHETNLGTPAYRIQKVTKKADLQSVSGKFLYFSSTVLVIATFDTYHKDIRAAAETIGEFKFAGRPVGYGRIEYGEVTSWKSVFFGKTPRDVQEKIKGLLQTLSV
jgi:glycosyltransferase involved in cell wall biosynthesis